jgi:phage terminase small subunit
MARKLTEKQQKFLDVLFEEAKGNPAKAIKLAGYAEGTPSSAVTNVLQEEIAELTKKYLATSATKAAYAMVNILEDPVALGNKEKMVAAKDILDRVGYKSSDKVEVQSASPLFILPPKENNNENDG